MRAAAARRSLQDQARVAGVGLGLLALLLALALAVPGVAGLALGPEAEVRAALAAAGAAAQGPGLLVPVPGAEGPLVATHAHFGRLSVRVEEGGARAVVAATLDLEGALATGAAAPVRVSSLGVEEVVLVREGGRWQPEAGWAPRLAAVLGALARPRPGDAGAPTAVTGWALRLERDSATVSERRRAPGGAGVAPGDSPPETVHALRLERRGQEFLFPAELR